MMYIGGVQDEAGNQAAAAAVQSYGGLESSPFQPPMTPLPPDFSLRGSDAFAAAGYFDYYRRDDQFGSASSSAAAAPGPVYFNDGQDLNSIVSAGFRPFFANSVPETGGLAGSHQAGITSPGGEGLTADQCLDQLLYGYNHPTGTPSFGGDALASQPPPVFSVEPRRGKKGGDAPGQRTSIYRGVTRHRWTGRYEAHLWDNSGRKEGNPRKGRQGGYDDEVKAAQSYDMAAIKYWGSDAITNFPASDYSEEMEEMKDLSRQEFIATLRRRSSGFSRGASIYRGVTRHRHQGRRWQARIGRVSGNRDLYLGTFATEEEAAEAYDIAAIKFRGTRAVTNFEISRYDIETILTTTLPIGNGAKRQKLGAAAAGGGGDDLDRPQETSGAHEAGAMPYDGRVGFGDDGIFSNFGMVQSPVPSNPVPGPVLPGPVVQTHPWYYNGPLLCPGHHPVVNSSVGSSADSPGPAAFDLVTPSMPPYGDEFFVFPPPPDQLNDSYINIDYHVGTTPTRSDY
ncbi:unnamed protein product [Cuscuta campestris]|uniref:AP2/ERF domain-containing protein n=1 Tax=Cuscuta campestris TaxID=132261 RepID=A0A484MI10_9ASTE|nr:unnamed protein product [Cuscuta campestris]